MKRQAHDWLEKTFGRKTVTSVGVFGALGKSIETGLVPFVDPAAAVNLSRFGTWLAVFGAMCLISIYWRRIIAAADEIDETIEDTIDE